MQIETGTIVEGKVTGITDFGAFVELESGKSGMVHISEIASDYVKDIREHLKIGQQVKCKVLSISPEGKISLSIRKASDEDKQDSRRSADRQKPAAAIQIPRSGRGGSLPRPKGASSPLRI